MSNFNFDIAGFNNNFNNLVNLDIDIYESYFRNHIYRYGYKFNDSKDRNEFIKWIKNQDKEFYETNEVENFIYRALNGLDKICSLSVYDIIIYPDDSHNLLVKKILKCLSSYISKNNIMTYKLLKALPEKVEFCYNAYILEHLDASESQLNEAKKDAEALLNNIHNQNSYFSISHNVVNIPLKKRKYLREYLHLSEADSKSIEALANGSKVLIVDDVSTTGSTLNEMLRVLSKINNKLDIQIFTLIGNMQNNNDKKILSLNNADLTESIEQSLQKNVEDKRFFGIVSAMCRDESDIENAELKKAILNRNYSFIKMLGTIKNANSYEEKEEGIIIIGSKDNELEEKYLLQFVKDLGREFEQEKVAFINSEGNATIIYTKDSENHKIDEEEYIGKFDCSELENIYSKIKGGSFKITELTRIGQREYKCWSDSMCVEAERMKHYERKN